MKQLVNFAGCQLLLRTLVTNKGYNYDDDDDNDKDDDIILPAIQCNVSNALQPSASSQHLGKEM